MELTIQYIFVPTSELAKVAERAGKPELLECSVWMDKDHDRVGPEHDQSQLESAFWAIFLANLIEDAPESAEAVRLRDACIALGFQGCWRVLKTKAGGVVSDLAKEGVEATRFVQSRGISLV